MIRKLERKDKKNWIKLYCGYAKFYKVTMSHEILDTLWEWIHNETHNAKKLYDKIANNTGFELYELKRD